VWHVPDQLTKRTAPGAALYEAAGLRWLAAVSSGADVVEVIEASEREIVLTRLAAVRADPEAAADFGRRLAVTHDEGAAAFGAPPEGWEGDGWIGTEPIDLFGAPYLDRILSAYESASSWLPPRWRSLIGLHQLHPLLVHAAIFGGNYGARAVAITRHYL
jgi:fructosamine-3-kinase